MTTNNPSGRYEPVAISFRISAHANRLLTEATIRSGRSKSKEARFRLEDHLARFKDMETISGHVSMRGQGDD